MALLHPSRCCYYCIPFLAFHEFHLHISAVLKTCEIDNKHPTLNYSQLIYCFIRNQSPGAVDTSKASWLTMVLSYLPTYACYLFPNGFLLFENVNKLYRSFWGRGQTLSARSNSRFAKVPLNVFAFTRDRILREKIAKCS